MPIPAFKGITKVFKKGKEYMSPTLGEVALETGLIHDIRFYWNFTAGFKPDGTNEYIRDASNDPLWLLVKDLMPSPAGAIAPTVNNALNFGRFATPESVAVMLNYTNIMRTQTQSESPRKLDSEFSLLKLEEKILTSPESSPTKKKKKKGAIKPRFTLRETQAKIAELEAVKQRIVTEKEHKNKLGSQLATDLLGSLDEKAIESFLKEEHLNSLMKAELEKDQQYTYLNNELQKEIARNDIPAAQITKELIEARSKTILQSKRTFDANWGILKDEALAQKKAKWSAKLKNQTIDQMVKHINDALDQESTSLAPKYTLEQMITAFFDEQFNTRADMRKLLDKLDDDIVDRAEVEQFDVNDKLDKDGVTALLNKKELDMDDVYALCNISIFTSPIPYKSGDTPVSNSKAQKYDRANNVLLNDTIAECVEMVGRHLSNMLLFNTETRQFDLTHIKKSIKDINPFFKNFEEFFQVQSPQQANDGSITIRSAWNKVVADMNAFGDPIKINYVRATNELNAGYINLIKVFQKLFNLDLAVLPNKADYANSEDYHKAQIAWVGTEMNKVFKAMNPKYTYETRLSSILQSHDEVSGVMHVSAKQEHKEIFSFDIRSEVNSHADITNLKTIATIKGLGSKISERLEKTNEELLKDTGGSLISLMRLAGVKLRATSPLYYLFYKKLQDNSSRGDLLWAITEQYINWQRDSKVKDHMNEINMVVEHILEQTSWDDQAAVDHVSDPIWRLVRTSNNEDLNRIAGEKVKAFKYATTEEYVGDLLHFKSVRKLSIPRVKKLDSKILERLGKLEELIFDNAEIENLILEAVPTLKKITMDNNSALSSVDLKNLEALEDITLKDPKDKLEHVKLEGLTSLKKFDISNKKQLKTLSLKKLDALEAINMYGLYQSRGLQEIRFEELRSLKQLDLKSASKAENLIFRKLDALEELSLYTARTKNVTVEDMGALKEINLSHTSELRSLSLKNLDTLERLNLDGSAIKKLSFAGNFTNLSRIDLTEDVFIAPDFKIEGLAELMTAKQKAGKKLEITGISEEKLTQVMSRPVGIDESDLK